MTALEEVAVELRSRWLPAGAAAAVAVVAFGAVALSGGAGGDVGTARPVGTWEPMAPSPLAARLRPVMEAWGNNVVVVGGRIEPPCGPSAGCVGNPDAAQRDGALYDASTDTWERLPDAPVPLDFPTSAVLHDVLYVWLPGADDATPRLLALDLAERRWSQLPPAPATLPGYVRLTAAGDRLVAYSPDHSQTVRPDLAWLPSEQRWQQQPTALLSGSFDRAMVWTGDRLVLVTAAATEDQDRVPFMRAAVLQAASWRELPPQETVIGGSLEWSWTGDRLVSAYTARADGGETNPFDRAYPSGGHLDPSTGRWSELPVTPDGHQRGAGLPYAAGGRWVSNGEGLVLDATHQRWLVPPEQPDAPDQDAAAAWAGGRLVVWGGAAGMAVEPSDPAPRLLATGAVWTPPQG